MKQFLITFGGVFAALVLFFVVIPIGVVFVVLAANGPPRTPNQTVLNLDLRGALTDHGSSEPLAALTGGGLSVTRIELTLRQAGGDPRVKGLIVRLPESGMDPAAADEIAQALRRFEARGKHVVAFSQGLYAGGVATSTYALGAAANELWMQPGAPFEATGISSEEIFLARFFNRFGVDAQFQQRGRFKTAVNGYLQADYTPAHRQSELSWMNAVLDAAIASIARDREMDETAVRAAIEHGPYDADAAKAAGLIDQVGQAEDARNAALKAAGAEAQVVEFADYTPPPGRLGLSGGAIAVINVEGVIATGYSGYDPLNGAVVGSDDIAGIIYDAIDDPSIKAIVLRVSSPGGSDTASEQIGAAVRAAKDAGKPVVVSMGTYAASGGYWISAGADYIVAQPTTLTGSIGVYGGKISVGEAAARYGVDLRSISVGGDYADVNALGHPFTPAQEAAYAAQIDKVYARFIARVSDGRHIPPEKVREMAEGRVWTGAQALRLGLVDELGGLTQAVDKAKALAGLKGQVRLIMLPSPPSALQALQQLAGVSALSAKGLAAAGALMDDKQASAVLRTLADDRLRGGGDRVLAPRVLP